MGWKLNGVNFDFGFFCNDKDEPCSFIIYPSPKKSQHNRKKDSLATLIQGNGGVVVSQQTPFSIKLLDIFYFVENNIEIPPVENRRSDLFSSQFIYDSICQRKIAELNDYRCSRSKYAEYDINDVLFRRLSWNDLTPKALLKELSSKQVNLVHSPTKVSPQANNVTPKTPLKEKSKSPKQTRLEQSPRQITTRSSGLTPKAALKEKSKSPERTRLDQSPRQVSTRTTNSTPKALLKGKSPKKTKLAQSPTKKPPPTEPVVSPVDSIGFSDFDSDTDFEEVGPPAAKKALIKRHKSSPVKSNVSDSDFVQRGTPFAREEDKLLLDLVIKHNWYAYYAGNEIYKWMEGKKLFKRTFQSLKNRFQRYIIPNLHTYKLGAEILEKFAKGKKRMKKGRREVAPLPP